MCNEESIPRFERGKSVRKCRERRTKSQPPGEIAEVRNLDYLLRVIISRLLTRNSSILPEFHAGVKFISTVVPDAAVEVAALAGLLESHRGSVSFGYTCSFFLCSFQQFERGSVFPAAVSKNTSYST